MPLQSAEPPPVHAIFFDAVGTLIRLQSPVGETYARFASAHGLNLDPSLLTDAFLSAWTSLPQPQNEGIPAMDDEKNWWKELVNRCICDVHGSPIPPAIFDPLFEQIYYYFADPDAWVVYSDVIQSLAALSKNHRLFVLSNFDQRLRPVLDGLGLSPFFARIIISSEIGASKPHPLIFSAAARLAGCPPHHCLLIGDDPNCDLHGAVHAGFQAILLDRRRQNLHQITLGIASTTRHV